MAKQRVGAVSHRATGPTPRQRSAGRSIQPGVPITSIPVVAVLVVANLFFQPLVQSFLASRPVPPETVFWLAVFSPTATGIGGAILGVLARQDPRERGRTALLGRNLSYAGLFVWLKLTEESDDEALELDQDTTA